MAGSTAVVIGSSMAGLLAARVLADHFNSVTIVERDTLPPGPDARKGVPQGRHAHGLLTRGREVLDDLFPGFTDEMMASGAVVGDVTLGVTWVMDGQRHLRAPSGLLGYAVTRPLLEAHVRARTLALPNVCVVENCSTEGFRWSEDRTRVTGIETFRDGLSGAMAADLIVDASGRGSQTPAWIAQMGYERPPEELVHVGITYSTRVFRRTKAMDRVPGAMIGPTAASPRGGFMIRVEDMQWIVTLCGYGEDRPPASSVEWVEFARTLACRDIYDTISACEPLTEPVTFHYPASQRRRYEALQRFPQGLLPFGDAIASFNPVYAQGMSVAAIQAIALRSALQEGAGDGLAQRYFREASRAVDAPWDIAVGSDLRLPQVAGKRSGRVRVVNWYVGQVHRAATQDPAVLGAFHRVINLKARPGSLMSPGVAARVVRARLQSRRPSA